MNRLHPDLVKYLADQAMLGWESECAPEREEFFGNAHIRHWTDNFTFPAYHPYYFFLFLVARHLQPDFILELGAEVGRGMMVMHLGYPAAPIVGVDILDVSHNLSQTVQPIGRQDGWRLLVGDSLDFIKQAPEQTISMLQVDTSHTYEQTKTEYEAFRPMMKAGGVMLFDDVLLPGVSQAWIDFEDGSYNTRFIFPELHHGSGYGVILCNVGK